MTARSERHRLSRRLREIEPGRRPGRKTNRVRVEHRRPSLGDTPDHVLRFELPVTLGFALVPGPVAGLPGVTVCEDGKIEVRSRDRGFVHQQVAAMIKRQAKGSPAGRIFASYQRGEKHEEFEIVWMTGDPAVMIQGYSMRPFFAEGR